MCAGSRSGQKPMLEDQCRARCRSCSPETCSTLVVVRIATCAPLGCGAAFVPEVDAELNLATTPGKTADELYKLAAKAYADRCFPEQIEQHHQGGLIGYKCRHWIAQPGGTQVVKAGRAYAWNPTIAGKTIGTKSEDSASSCRLCRRLAQPQDSSSPQSFSHPYEASPVPIVEITGDATSVSIFRCSFVRVRVHVRVYVCK